MAHYNALIQGERWGGSALKCADRMHQLLSALNIQRRVPVLITGILQHLKRTAFLYRIFYTRGFTDMERPVEPSSL